MLRYKQISAITLAAMLFFGSSTLCGQVKQSSPNGFLLQVERTVPMDSTDAYETFVKDFSKWYDASHSYSGKAENLSINLKKHCMFEQLPDGGFVRHMEIVFHQPGRVLRLTGGLGPLQPMGIFGALSFTFSGSEVETKIIMVYNVSGADHQNLDKLALPVYQVLSQQMDHFRDYCKEKTTRERGEKE